MPLCWVSLWCFAFSYFDAKRSAECPYTECSYAECYYAECHYGELNHAECRGAL
jgi:hypothetical protein